MSVRRGAAKVGEPVTLAWSLPPTKKNTATRAYLMVLLPDAVRVNGPGFFALRAGAPNPKGVRYGIDRTRAIVPLNTAFAKEAGEILILPYAAVPLVLESAVVATDGCKEQIVRRAEIAPIVITAGAPALVARDEFSMQRPDRVIRAHNGPYKLHVFKDQFEVLDAASGVFILRHQGTEPKFSPTGRFLTLKTSLGETYAVLDVLARRLIGRYETSRMHWSHADSFLWFEDEHASKMQIVRTLHGLRYDLTENPPTRREAKYAKIVAGLLSSMDEEAEDRRPRPPTVDIEPEGTTCARGCYARDHWKVELSLDRGMVSFYDARHEGIQPQVLVYDLAAGHENFLFESTSKGRKTYKKRLGVEFPQFQGWNIGDKLQTTVIAYATDEEKELLTKTQSAAAPEAPAAETTGGVPRKVAARVGISRDPTDPGAAAASGVIGAQLTHLPTVWVAALRAGRDNDNLRGIEQEIAALYTPEGAHFGVEKVKNYYSRNPFPDPNEAPRKKPVEMNLLAEGRDLWRWSDRASTYWLTQGVSSDHLNHTFSLSLLARDETGKVRHANLIKAANDPEGTFVYKRTGDEDEDWELRNGVANIVPQGPYDLFSLGDFRTELGTAFGEPSVVAVSSDRYLIVLTKPVSRLLVFDLKTWRFVCGVPNPIDGAVAVATAMHASERHVTQVNSTGAVHVYACPTGQNVLNGAYVDDELVIMDKNGYFDGSEDVAGYVDVAVPGLPGRHLLSQFSEVLRRPGIALQVLSGEELPLPRITSPPALRIVSTDNSDEIRLEAFSSSGLQDVRIYADGVLYRRIPVSGNATTLSLGRTERARIGNLTAIAVNDAGIVSAPLVLAQPKESSARRLGRLLALAVGVDRYPLMPPVCGANRNQSCDLSFAAADAKRVAGAVAGSRRYSGVTTKIFTDERATSEAIFAELDAMIAQATPADTLMVSFAAHGLLDANKALQFGLSTTRLDDVEGTSLSFDAISAKLKNSRARVIVLLDVCHAGMADRASIATNDDAVSRLVTDSGASMVVFAASKGRQYSEEAPEAAGGRFSVAFDRIVARERDRNDSDRNGAISVNELYRGLKFAVVRESRGRQTPWLSRNLVVGDFDLF